ncbi:MAG: Nmad5 family putative nucleotide modification protein [Candidatus Bathyarchaeota archaeon]|jgi:hypothetical protein
MRLTNAIRDEVLSNVIKEKIDPKVEAIKDRVTQIAIRTVNSQYPESVKEWIAKAPEGGLSTRSAITLITADEIKFKHQLLLGDYPIQRFTNTYRISVPSHKVLAQDQYTTQLQASKRDSAKLNKMLKDLDALQKTSDAIKTTVCAALRAVTTVKQLSDNYPDLVRYMPKPEPAAKPITITNDRVAEILKL